MIKKSEIDEIIKIAIKEILDNSEHFNLDSFFIVHFSISLENAKWPKNA